jgi:DNA N-6-adenine-methyltransferase Dam
MTSGWFDPMVMRKPHPVEWYTPEWLWRLARKVMGGLDLDPCSNSLRRPNVPARRHYTKRENGLEQPWSGRVFLNPPYGAGIGAWIAKLTEEVEAGAVTQAVAVVPASTEARWFVPLWQAEGLCFLMGRMRFVDGATRTLPEQGTPVPIVAVYFGHREESFAQHFGAVSPVLRQVSAPVAWEDRATRAVAAA